MSDPIWPYVIQSFGFIIAISIVSAFAGLRLEAGGSIRETTMFGWKINSPSMTRTATGFK